MALWGVAGVVPGGPLLISIKVLAAHVESAPQPATSHWGSAPRGSRNAPARQLRSVTASSPRSLACARQPGRDSNSQIPLTPPCAPAEQCGHARGRPLASSKCCLVSPPQCGLQQSRCTLSQLGRRGSERTYAMNSQPADRCRVSCRQQRRSGLVAVRVTGDGAGLEAVGCCSTGAECLAQACAASADVMLLDFRLPDCTAMQVLDEARAKAAKLRILIYSGYLADELTAQLLRRALLACRQGGSFEALAMRFAGCTASGRLCSPAPTRAGGALPIQGPANPGPIVDLSPA